MKHVVAAAAAIFAMSGLAAADEREAPTLLTESEMDVLVAGEVSQSFVRTPGLGLKVLPHSSRASEAVSQNNPTTVVREIFTQAGVVCVSIASFRCGGD